MRAAGANGLLGAATLWNFRTSPLSATTRRAFCWSLANACCRCVPEGRSLPPLLQPAAAVTAAAVSNLRFSEGNTARVPTPVPAPRCRPISSSTLSSTATASGAGGLQCTVRTTSELNPAPGRRWHRRTARRAVAAPAAKTADAGRACPHSLQTGKALERVKGEQHPAGHTAGALPLARSAPQRCSGMTATCALSARACNIPCTH